MKKVRTVFYAEEGHKTFIERLLTQGSYRSESDTICYLLALGMQAHTQKQIEESGNAH
jgi:Arc/MetJ-type ribon-helix-helix transcriptional regulator